MKDVLYTIASSRHGRAFRVAFCLVWLFLFVELVPVDYMRGVRILGGDHGMVLASIILTSAVWTLSTISAFVNRTVFTESGIEKRAFLQGRTQFCYHDIRKLNIRGSSWFRTVSVLTYDGKQMIFVGNQTQLARAEEIIRERVPAIR